MELGAVLANIAAAVDQAALDVDDCPQLSDSYSYPVRSATAPFATTTPGESAPRRAYGTSARLAVKLRLFVGTPEGANAAASLYTFMGPAFVSALEAAAIEGVDSLAVKVIAEPQIYVFGQVELLGVELTLDVLAS